MRPPWLGDSQETAELEALQTDVMRFIAILGLCLAAIFSLVHSAALEQTEAVTVQAQRVPAPDARPAALQSALPEPAAPPPAAQSGFTLEFGSANALQQLLQQAQVKLYAVVQGQFWSVDVEANWVPASPPASYYQMHTQTVPQGLRASLPEHIGEAEPVWGVTLPLATSQRIEQLMTGARGGHLVIDARGGVELQ